MLNNLQHGKAFRENAALPEALHYSRLCQTPWALSHINALIFSLNAAGDLSLFPSAWRTAEAYAMGGERGSAVARVWDLWGFAAELPALSWEGENTYIRMIFQRAQPHRVYRPTIGRVPWWVAQTNRWQKSFSCDGGQQFDSWGEKRLPQQQPDDNYCKNRH